jgi:VWFA-related protein
LTGSLDGRFTNFYHLIHNQSVGDCFSVGGTVFVLTQLELENMPSEKSETVSLGKIGLAIVSCAMISAAVAIGVAAATGQSTSNGNASPSSTKQSTSGQTDSTLQAGKPAMTVSVQVSVVNVLATVRDKHGKIVPNLTQSDFVLTEDGRPQTIRYFTKESDLPLTLGLLVDTSLSQRGVLEQERSASHSFLDQMVREDKDRAFVIHFDAEVELLQDLTGSREKLEAALDSLQTPELKRASAGGNDPNDSDPNSGRGSGRHFGGGTLLYDAVYLASDELMKKQQGRKALIVLSDGVDRGSKETLETAIETAQRSDTVVYSILFKDDEMNQGDRGGFGHPRLGGGGGPMGGGGMGGPMGGGGRRGGGRHQEEPRPDGKKILDRISKETGGRLFEVSKKQPIDEIYSQIEEELRNQYSLGYTPDRKAEDAPGYRKIQMTTKEKNLTVQARAGYYADR